LAENPIAAKELQIKMIATLLDGRVSGKSLTVNLATGEVRENANVQQTNGTLFADQLTAVGN
jgi:hypothetical protein